MIIGKSVPRVDGYDKVTGNAKYAEDLVPLNALVAKVLHSTIANGVVKKFDLTKAKELPGIIAIYTCFDVPKTVFTTAGHIWSLDEDKQDFTDRHLLTDRVRYYGDDIAVVVGETDSIVKKALRLIEVEYLEYKPLLSIEESLNSEAEPIHDAKPNNILSEQVMEKGGSFDEKIKEPGLRIIESEYTVPMVQHVHIENPFSYAYMEQGKVVVVSATQIPHIVRRVVGQALDLPWGKVKIVKPYLGGGFGNKQDALYEPLNAWLTMKLNGRCVKLDITREETFVNTRTRHQMKFKFTTGVDKSGKMVASKMEVLSNEGAYASHSRTVLSYALALFTFTYNFGDPDVVRKSVGKNIYTNLPVAGAMRGYGTPQLSFALESHVTKIIDTLGLDQIEYRKKHIIHPGEIHPEIGLKCESNSVVECLDLGSDKFDFTNKHNENKNQTGNVRQGIGVGTFLYECNVYPHAIENAGCTMIMNQDGSIQVNVGASEIGQGSDTALKQIACASSGIEFDSIHFMSTQDTDVSPYDPGTYASRVTYVTGKAVKKAGEILKQKVMDFTDKLLKEEIASDIKDGFVVDKEGHNLLSVEEVAMNTFYHVRFSNPITVNYHEHCETNGFITGACFAEVEVDIELCKVKVNRLYSAHDSGKIINPQTAAGQVHGGQSMGIGYALYEEMLFDEDGKMINDNLLHYKIMTAKDTPELELDFVEPFEITGPYGNKGIGEPATVAVAAAIRNAVVNATGIEFDSIPITPQMMYKKFKENKLI